MQIIGVVASSNPFKYTLAQTYTAGATYTVPNGVSEIAVILRGPGGTAASGQNGSGSIGGGGAGGAGGGALLVARKIPVIAGNQFTISFSGNAKFECASPALALTAGGGGASLVSSGGAGGTASTSGTGNWSGMVTYSQPGGAGGNGGPFRNTNGNGNNAANGTAGASINLNFDDGLPSVVYAGSGGGGGGGGSMNSTTTTYFGGTEGNGGASENFGGYGGFSITPYAELNPGAPGAAGSTANGGGGGGGGAGGAAGSTNGGAGGAGGSGIIYIYER